MDKPVTVYAYKAPKARALSDEEIEKGIQLQAPPHHPGIPLRDLLAEDIEDLPDHMLATLDASPLYEGTPEGKRKIAAIRRSRRPAAEEAPEAPAAEETPKKAPKE